MLDNSIIRKLKSLALLVKKKNGEKPHISFRTIGRCTILLRATVTTNPHYVWVSFLAVVGSDVVGHQFSQLLALFLQRALVTTLRGRFLVLTFA